MSKLPSLGTTIQRIVTLNVGVTEHQGYSVQIHKFVDAALLGPRPGGCWNEAD